MWLGVLRKTLGCFKEMGRDKLVFFGRDCQWFVVSLRFGETKTYN